jgi:hypothetical protein
MGVSTKRGGAVAARRAHNPEAAGSSPAPVTRLVPPPRSKGEARQGRRETAPSSTAPACVGPGWWHVDATGNAVPPPGQTVADLVKALRRGAQGAGFRVVGRGAG